MNFNSLFRHIFPLLDGQDKKPYTPFDAVHARLTMLEAKQNRELAELKDFNAIKDNLLREVYHHIHLAAKEERSYIRIAYHSLSCYEPCDIQWPKRTMELFVMECKKQFEDQGYNFTYNPINTTEDCAHIYIEWMHPKEG